MNLLFKLFHRHNFKIITYQRIKDVTLYWDGYVYPQTEYIYRCKCGMEKHEPGISYLDYQKRLNRVHSIILKNSGEIDETK